MNDLVMTGECISESDDIDPQNEESYTTKREKEFLKFLGLHWGKKSSRAVLLRKYLKAAKKRINWGDIDSKEVIAYAKALLKS